MPRARWAGCSGSRGEKTDVARRQLEKRRERLGERSVAEELLRRLREHDVRRLLARERCRLRTGLRGGVGRDAAGHASGRERFAVSGERGRRGRELLGAGSETDEDQLAARAGGERLGDREQAGYPTLVAGENEDGAPARARRLLERELRVLLQDGALELAEGRRRLDPKLGVEPLARRAIDVERVRLPAGSVQRSHQRADEALVQRMRANERLELGNELGVTTDRKVGLDP